MAFRVSIMQRRCDKTQNHCVKRISYMVLHEPSIHILYLTTPLSHYRQSQAFLEGHIAADNVAFPYSCRKLHGKTAAYSGLSEQAGLPGFLCVGRVHVIVDFDFL